MRTWSWALTLTALVAILGCGDTTGPQPGDDAVRGRVLSLAGAPVAGAAVVLQYATDPPAGRTFDKPQTGIVIQLPAQGLVSIWIARPCDEAVLRHLVDGELPPGAHQVVWDGCDDQGRTLPDGAYRWHVVTPEGASSRDILRLLHGYGDLPAGATLAPLAVTDAAGRFALDQACLPLGFTETAVDEDREPMGEVTVTREVVVWAFDPVTGAAATAAATIDRAAGADVTLVLPE